MARSGDAMTAHRLSRAVGGAVIVTAIAAASCAVVAPAAGGAARLASTRPGEILRSRKVALEIGAVPVAALGATAYQLRYRTTDAHGHPTATWTTVIVPNGKRPAGGRDLISLQDAENSDSARCAPSVQLRNGGVNSFVDFELASLLPELDLGRVIVIPDALGPRSEFFASAMEGHAVLDSIRAVEGFGPSQVDGRRTKVALIGYSEGAHQTEAAAELAPTYAPRLRIVGVAAGGLPVGDVATLRYLAAGDPANVLQVMTGLTRAYPRLRWQRLLNASGRAASKTMSTCSLVELLAGPSAPFASWTKPRDAFAVKRVSSVLASNALGRRVPAAPTYLFIGKHDEEVAKSSLDRLVARDCKRGARIDYDVDPVGVEHFESFTQFAPLALGYVDGRLTGDRVPDTCS